MKSKNILIIVLINFLFFACAEKSSFDKRYPYKSGKIVYKNTVQLTTITQTLYFENFGEMEAISSNIDMNGQNVAMKSIYKGKYCYTASSTSNKINKIEIDRNRVNHLGFFTVTPELLTNESASEIGNETIDGKKCAIYTIQKKDYDMKFWVWKNVIIKLISKYRGSTMTRTVIQLEKIDNMPTSLFEIPSE